MATPQTAVCGTRGGTIILDARRDEAEISRLIERCSGRDPDPDELEPSYIESVGRYHASRRREARAEWAAFHTDQTERIERAAAALVEGHRRRAQELLCQE